jgi:hypothetical protein
LGDHPVKDLKQWLLTKPSAARVNIMSLKAQSAFSD